MLHRTDSSVVLKGNFSIYVIVVFSIYVIVFFGY